MSRFVLYLIVMAGITYLIRLLPILLIKKEIKNRFVLSFLHYIPYTVLTVMTIPAIFTSTSYFISAAIGFLAAVILSYLERSLTEVAIASTAAVLIVEEIIQLL